MRSASSARRSASAAARARETSRGGEEIAVDALQRIEGFERVLEDRLHRRHEAHACASPARVRHIEPAEPDRALRRSDEVQDHARKRRLAAPGLADDGEDLGPGGGDREADVVDGGEGGAAKEAAPGVGLGDAFDGEEVLAQSAASAGSLCAAGFTAGLAAKHATRWPGASVVSSGTSRRQISIASGQRGWKRQPGGGAERFGGAPPRAFFSPTSPILRQALDQMGGVGVKRLREDFAGRRLFDQAAGVHDAEPVGHVGVHGHVVRDEQDRRAHLALDLADHAEHALLHDHVERGRGLVGDDELRPADGCERDGDPLAHAAGQLVRIGVEHRGLEVQPLQVALDDCEELGLGLADMRVRRSRRRIA